MILERILARKQEEVAAARARVSLDELRARGSDLEPCRPFGARLRQRAAGGTAVIAEVKKGSPSKGIIRADFDPIAIACAYERGGAACLSVLTDEDFFHGRLDYLAQVRKVVALPLLRKDFVVDAYQIHEARVAGADAVLLIAAALDDGRLEDFSCLAAEIGLEVLLEVHDEEELARALATPAALIGVNNRNLSSFVTDLGISERLMPLIPSTRLRVAESGIHDRADLQRLKDAGADAFLIGESLMREADIEAKLRSLID
ncbi:indole-3-glycerol phosphate synthase TrpC [Geoalkalibacter halelectricus]|uniref:Indole-3-glycerol phosphate synthase n=1 Tax=Geoalkalibacter halelectricus TaxID=2847045 RepID=A0ABY5ZIU3_9BACT|nr:indole-3-glycerol phosphate synthase TrpC [Geoalkalibacter halelectricus]MDO3379107.1 indole-3-glycerol phosphate synthase TrpC [Geoalkalibacter halelectricus]UWZ78993.1 indole-3-glycerol phosphate synthase TrpC [Geoalkalibacter halelectricus]